MAKKKPSDFAMGIPTRKRMEEPPVVKTPKIWQFVRHDHKAERAGKHYDLRLGDPGSGITYNWAGKKWPEPGKGTYVIMQPTHDYNYLNFEGRIPSGQYGAGTVRIGRREPTEVVNARPDRVDFNLYKGRVPEQYALRRVGKIKWVLNNVTPSRDTNQWQDVPSGKPKYREGSSDWVDFGNKEEVLQAKIDGAHAIYALRGGKPMKAFSYRIAKSTPTKLLEHTYKIPGWEKNVVPPAFNNTILRGEVYATDKKGKALKEKDVGGLLNTSTLASREKQRVKGGLQTAVFDVVKYRGRDVSNLPYEKRLSIVKDVVAEIPGLHLPPMAETPADKQELLRRVQDGKEKLTREGVVAWNLKKNKTTKIKFRPDYDIYVRGVVPSKHPGWAGAVSYSLTPKGPVVGTMGSGFTHAELKAMLKNPDKYVGRVARVKAHDQFESGALRVPVFKGWHQQKSEEKLYKEGTIRKRKGKYELLSKNRRVLGTHPSRAAALKQERAIQVRKRLKAVLG